MRVGPRRTRAALAIRLAGAVGLVLAPGGCDLFPDRRLDAGSFVSGSVDTQDDRDLFAGVEIIVDVGPVDGEPWVSWRADCNTASAPARLDGERLVLTDTVITTAMACDDPEQDDQDEWLERFFESGPRWDRTDDGLRLRSADGTSEIVLDRRTPDGG